MKKKQKPRLRPAEYLRPTTPAVKIIGVIMALNITAFLIWLVLKVYGSPLVNNGQLLVFLAVQLIIGFWANKVKPE